MSTKKRPGKAAKKVPTRKKKPRTLAMFASLTEPTLAFIREITSGMKRTGSPGVTVAESLGVSRAKFGEWLKRGRDDETSKRDTPFARMFIMTSAVAAENEMRDSKIVGASKDWRARIARLERLRPDQWAAPSRASGGSTGGPEEWQPAEPPAWANWGLGDAVEVVRIAAQLGLEKELAEGILANVREAAGMMAQIDSEASEWVESGVSRSEASEATETP